MDKRFFRALGRGSLHVAMGLVLIIGASAGASAQSQSGQSLAGTPAPSADVPQQGLLGEPHAMSKAITFILRKRGDSGTSVAKDGFYPDMGNMPTGSGWISAGPGFRHHVADGRVLFDGSAAISWRAYKVAQGRFELPRLAHDHLTIGSQGLWRDATQVTYFGTGRNSLETDRSEYRVRAVDVVGYATVRANDWLSIGGRVGWLRRPEILPTAGPFKRGNPDFQVTFPNDAAILRGQQPNYLHGEASVVADTRDHAGHPTRGGLYRAAWTSFSDRNGGTFSFQRYEAEGVQFIPVVADRWTIALHGFGVFSDVPAGNDVPFYLMPGLGGHNSIRSYTDYRFHDRDLVLVSAESRWGLTAHLDAAVFVDAGNVAARAGDLDLNKRAYGVGLRVHGQTHTLFRFDAAHGSEGWHMSFRLNDPFRLSRLLNRTAPIPFVH